MVSEEAAAKEKSDAAKHRKEHQNAHDNYLQKSHEIGKIVIPCVITFFIVVIFSIFIACVHCRKKARQQQEDEHFDVVTAEKKPTTLRSKIISFKFEGDIGSNLFKKNEQ